MPLQYELVFQTGNQRFYQLNFSVTTSDEKLTEFVCISDAFVWNRYERYVFPVISKNDSSNENFDPIVDYLEIEGYIVSEDEGDFDYLPTDSNILESLFINYKNRFDAAND